jgi:hypothetical protein
MSFKVQVAVIIVSAPGRSIAQTRAQLLLSQAILLLLRAFDLNRTRLRRLRDHGRQKGIWLEEGVLNKLRLSRGTGES